MFKSIVIFVCVPIIFARYVFGYNIKMMDFNRTKVAAFAHIFYNLFH